MALAAAPSSPRCSLFPRFSSQRIWAFLVDTGADGTLLAPRDAALLGIDIASLPIGPPSTGVGGTVRTVQIAATITLGTHTYDLTLRILAPATRAQRLASARIPSLLGRDILARFALFYDHAQDLVLLLEADEAADLRRHLP